MISARWICPAPATYPTLIDFEMAITKTFQFMSNNTALYPAITSNLFNSQNHINWDSRSTILSDTIFWSITRPSVCRVLCHTLWFRLGLHQTGRQAVNRYLRAVHNMRTVLDWWSWVMNLIDSLCAPLTHSLSRSWHEVATTIDAMCAISNSWLHCVDTQRVPSSKCSLSLHTEQSLPQKHGNSRLLLLLLLFPLSGTDKEESLWI